MKERMRGTMMELIGFLPVEVSKERVVAELPFRDDLTQPTGPLHAGDTFKLLKNKGYCREKAQKP
jgi:acyl-coenzyme A thioesterase PaaI-like protein